MKYYKPLNATDENAPYILGDVQKKIFGSELPPQAIEHPQREIINAIITAGLTPDANDNAQLYKAIQLMFKKNPANPDYSVFQSAAYEEADDYLKNQLLNLYAVIKKTGRYYHLSDGVKITAGTQPVELIANENTLSRVRLTDFTDDNLNVFYQLNSAEKILIQLKNADKKQIIFELFAEHPHTINIDWFAIGR